MERATNAGLWVVRITGIVQVILGLLFWNHRAVALVPLHMAIGLAFVLGLWTLAALATWARVRTAYAVVAALWGIIVLALGMTQGAILPGRAHWVVQTLHLIVGIAAMALGNVLAARIRKRRSATASSHPRPSGTAEGSLSPS
jgi:uncharacterized membrane protein HdeD (DUF308 family)